MRPRNRTREPRAERLENRRLLTTAFPTPAEQYMVELINRARANPLGEAVMDGINLNEGLASSTITPDPKQPLAINPNLVSSAEAHDQWMLANNTVSHDENGVTPATRMQNAGYVFTPPSGSGENIAFRGSSAVPPLYQTVAQEEKDLFVDSADPARAHRLNLLNPLFTDVGVGVAAGALEGFNAVLSTQDFAFSASSGPNLTGAVYTDARIHNNFYDPGEGIGGVTVTATRILDGATFSTTTWASGGYTLPLPAGVYTVAAASPTLGGTVTANNVAVTLFNVQQDFTPLSPAYVAGRYVLYNNSLFDGNTPAPGIADDGAIAPDKQALLPGYLATFVNYTSYSKGINGIMVDLANSPSGATVSQSDFTFKVGNTNDPQSYTAAPTASGFLVRPGAGIGQSTRVEFTWPDGAISNKWLQVTVAANGDTGLLVPDVFYFGNAVGESGNIPGDTTVDFQDELVARSDPHPFFNPAPITDAHDYNRDGKVDATDQIIARDNATTAATLLNLITPLDVPPVTTATAVLSPTDALPLTRKPRPRHHRREV